MSYVNAGPIVFTDTDTLDSPNDAVTNADKDNLIADFDVEFDTAYASLYCYIGTVAGPDVFITRLKPDGTDLVCTLTEKDDYTDTAMFTDSTRPLALNTVGNIKITHNAANLVTLLLDDVEVDSATIADLDMGDGVFHLGYFGAGSATVTNINVQSVVTPAIVSHEEALYLGQGYYAINAEGIPTSTYYGADIGGEDAAFVARNSDLFVFQLTDEINALTANDPADDPAVDGYEVRIWYGD